MFLLEINNIFIGANENHYHFNVFHVYKKYYINFVNKGSILYLSGSQPVCCGTPVCRDKYTGVPRSTAVKQ